MLHAWKWITTRTGDPEVVGSKLDHPFLMFFKLQKNPSYKHKIVIIDFFKKAVKIRALQYIYLHVRT